MRKSVLKNVLLSVFFAIFMAASIFGLALSNVLPKRGAKAETTWQTGLFEMDDGASLKLGEVGGLRFIVRMDETVANFVKENDSAELGFVIAPKNLMLEANGDYLNMSKKIGGAIDKNKIYQDGDDYCANGCITNIKQANLERSFTAVAYIKYNGEVRYTEYNDLARNNLYDTVNMAALYGYADAIFNENAGGYAQAGENEGWFGSDQYPIMIENSEEYTALVDIANKQNIDLSSFHVVVKNNATPSYGFANSEFKPASIISNALYTVNGLIQALPDTMSMPNAIGFVAKIHDIEEQYEALTDVDKAEIENYAKLESLLNVIEGYDRVYKNDATDGTVVASHVPNYTSAVGGTATTRADEVYGNVLTVTSNAEGKAALLYQNFPSIEKYAKIYFYVKVDVGCDLYLSDGITNDGWGANWKNTWSADGYWCNANTWRLVEIEPADGYIGTDFALGFRADNPGFTFEISDFYGIVNEKAEKVSTLTFGVMTDSGTKNEYGKVYNISQEQYFIDKHHDNTIGSLPTNKLANALSEGYEHFYFWMYNPTDTAYNFHLAGSVTAGWADSKDTFALTPKAWTKITISATDIALNKQGQWYVYITGGDGQGATKAGWQISTIYEARAVIVTKQEAALDFGAKTDTGTTNEYGKIYNISREQWYVENNINNTIGTLQASQLANALPAGYEHFYFWMYNPTDTTYSFHLAGGNTWTDSADSYSLTPKAWTKIVISAADIQLNTLGGTWYVYILGADGQGAAKDGWQISTIYAGPDKVEQTEIVYLDHADVKEAIALINAIPETVTTAGEAAIKAARAAYDTLTDAQKTMVSNASKLTAAETTLENIISANEVVAMIDAINARELNEALVQAARNAYNELNDNARAMVTNLSKLEGYEAEINAANSLQAAVNNVNNKISALPDSVVMPDHLVFVSRIEEARDAYEALSDEGKALITDYAKLRTLVKAIKGYETVYTQTVEGVNVIPSYVPGNGYSSAIGGSASMGYDGYYGSYLKVTSDEGGRAAIQFINFPDVSKYTKIYFNIRVVGASCDIYASDGITNNGWGDNWNNTWSLSGYWVNDGNWIQKEIDLTGTYLSSNGATMYIKNIFTSNWALGLRTATAGVSFEITNIVGFYPDHGAQTGLTFGNFTNSGTTNEYGTVYNLTQGWTGNDTDLGAFNVGALSGAINTAGHDALRFYIYNPNESAVDLKITGDMNGWNPTGEYVTNLPAKVWTKVELTPKIVEENKKVKDENIEGDTSGQWFVNVTSGASKAGWQISPIYSYSTAEEAGDEIDNVQVRLDGLNTETPDEYQTQLAREAYEALIEAQKTSIDTTNLVACETAIYGDVQNAPFIVDGVTNYKLYYVDEAKWAAGFANEHFEAATGVGFALNGQKLSITKYDYAIVFGGWDLYHELNGQQQISGLTGRADYVIEKIGRTVFILANNGDGYRLGAIAFLNEMLGYDMISEDCIVYDNINVQTLPELNSVVTPSFDYRQKQTAMSDAEVYGMGLQSNKDLWIPSSEGWDMHNTLHYLPTATYQSAHPAWYYSYKDSNGKARTQICPTAGGSSTEFNAMVAAIAENMLVRINMFPDRENISFSIMDTADKDDCTCARCKLYDTLYGEGGFAAAWIDLMNAVNAKIRESLPQDRVLNIAFLAYRGTEKAPANIDANGNVTLLKRYQINDDGSYTQTNEDLKCDNGVTVWLAPINAKYAENFNHADNAEHLATVKKWCALSDSVYLWLYGTNFKYFLYPYNTWQASAENYKIFYDLGVKAVWSQSNETEEMTAFTDLKGYIDSKFMFDVNADYETVLDTYFTNYFGPAAAKMREMFDTIVAKCNTIESENDGLGRGIYDDLEYESGSWFWETTNTYWSEDELNALVALCNEAKAAVNAPSLTDEQKTAILNRITKESLFPRYVLCTIYKNKSDREAFKADATALGLTLYREADGELNSLYSSWGV